MINVKLAFDPGGSPGRLQSTSKETGSMQGIAFGPTIRLLRQAKGISLRELARQLGVSPAFLSQIEAGRQHKIPRARIVQVAEMLGVSEGYLLSTCLLYTSDAADERSSV